MRRVRFLVMAAWLPTLIVGCAAMTTVVSDEEQAGMRTLAVASALGDTFQGRYLGLTVFNNKRYDADVSAWNVDDAAVKVAADLLSQAGRFRVVPIEAASQARDPAPFLAAARAAGADTLVLIIPTEYDNLPYLPGGYGFRHELIGGKTGGCVFLLAMVKVYDVAESRQVAWRWALGRTNLMVGRALSLKCYGGEDPVGWRDDFSQYSDPERERLRLATIESLETNIALALVELNLAPK